MNNNLVSTSCCICLWLPVKPHFDHNVLLYSSRFLFFTAVKFETKKSACCVPLDTAHRGRSSLRSKMNCGYKTWQEVQESAVVFLHNKQSLSPQYATDTTFKIKRYYIQNKKVESGDCSMINSSFFSAANTFYSPFYTALKGSNFTLLCCLANVHKR